MPLVNVEGVGLIDFPEGMSGEDIGKAIKNDILPKYPKLAAQTNRSWGEVGTDVLSSLATGVGGLAQVPGQLTQLAGLTTAEDADKGLQGLGKQLEQFGQESKSTRLKGKEAVRAEKISQADGMLAEFGTAIKETIKDPALLTSFFAEQLPNLAGSWGGGLLARGATKALMAEATGTALGKAGVRGAVGTGAVMQGADIGSETYEAVYKDLKKQGMDDEQANGIALSKGRVAGIEAAMLSLAATKLPGGTTIEKAMAGKGLPTVGGVAKGLFGEAASEGFEEGGGKFASNVGIQEINPAASLTKGVGSAAGMGALGGGLFGGVAGYTQSRAQAAEDQRTQQIEAQKQAAQDLIDQVAAAEDQARRDAFEAEQEKIRIRALQEQAPERFNQSEAFAELQAKVDKAIASRDKADQAKEAYKQSAFHEAQPDLLGDVMAQREQQAAEQVPPKSIAQAGQMELGFTDESGQMNLPGMPTPVPPPTQAEAPIARPVTEADFTAMNINKTNKKLREQLLGKDLNDPVQVQEVRDTLESWVQQGRGESINKGVGQFLDAIPKPLEAQEQGKLGLRRPYGSVKKTKPEAELSAEEQDLLQQELQNEQADTEEQIAGEPVTPISGPSEPSVRVPSVRPATPTGPRQSERRGMVPVGNTIGQPIGGAAPVQRALEASGNLNKRQIKEFDEARDKYFAGKVDERTAQLDEKRGKPKGDPQEIALQMLAADLHSGENLTQAKRFHRGLPEAAKAYVADEISRLESLENKANAEIDRLDAIRLTQQQTAEAQGLGNIREKLTELGSDRLDVRDAIDTAKNEGNEKEASRLLKKLNSLDERIKTLEEQLPKEEPKKKKEKKENPKVKRIDAGKTTDALTNAVAAGNLNAALNAIAKDTSDTFNILEKLISSRLLANKGSLPKIEIVPAGTIQDGAAQYNPFTDTVQINEGEVDSHTVLHETVHGFLHALIQKFEGGASNKGIADLKRLYDFIQDNHPELANRYGMESLTEFASELMSNREFQEELKNIPYRTENQSLFSAFVRAVLNALGLSPTQKLSALASGLMAADQSLALGRKIQEDVVTGKETMPTVNVKRDDLASNYKATGAERRAKPTEDTGAFQSFKNSTKSTAAAKQGFSRFLNTAETMLFSADAALNNAIRKGLEAGGKSWETIREMMYEVSTSQATHADALGMQFLQQGGLDYDAKAFKWKAVDKPDSWAKLIQVKLSGIADKYNITLKEAEKYAQQAFVANRLKGLAQAKRSVYSHMTQAEIDAGLKFFDMIPELKSLQDSWNAVRKNAMNVAIAGGLYTEAQSKELLDIMDYVPFYRIEQLAQNAGPKEYGRGLIDFAKGYKIEGSEQEVANIFDNMERWTSYTVSRAVKNRSALNLYNTAKALFPDEVTDLRQDARVKREQNTIDLWENGVRKKVEFKDPLFVHAFTGIESAAIPHFGIMSSVANFLRKNIVLMPLFSISQLSQDSFGAMLTSGLKHPWLLPLEVAKEFTKTLRGRSAAATELTKYGAVGVKDYSATFVRDTAEVMAGLKEETKLGKVGNFLEKFAMASDNAVRQAIYNLTMKETNGDKALAIERAFEIINFKRAGASGKIQMMRQVVPFFGAYLQAQNVVYKVLSGKGIAPQQRKEAQRVLMANALKISALAFMYAAIASDDDDYQKMDPQIRDRHLLIPGTSIMLPLRSDLTLLPKLIAEYTYLGMTDNAFTDGKKIRRAMGDALANAVMSPTAVPQAVKPILEVATNHNFFTGRAIVGQGIANKITEEQYTNSTSELAKLIGSTGLIAPVNVDHLIKGYMGTTGGLGLMATNAIVNGTKDQPKPEKSWQDAIATTPGLSAFVAREYGNADKNDFYELREEVDKINTTLNAMKKQGRAEDYKELLEENKDLMKVKSQVNNIGRQLTKLREYENHIYDLPEAKMDAEKKGKEIERIREQEKVLLKNVHSLRVMAGY